MSNSYGNNVGKSLYDLETGEQLWCGLTTIHLQAPEGKQFVTEEQLEELYGDTLITVQYIGTTCGVKYYDPSAYPSCKISESEEELPDSMWAEIEAYESESCDSVIWEIEKFPTDERPKEL